jgi:1,4-alpha-glucan branching enzyme
MFEMATRTASGWWAAAARGPSATCVPESSGLLFHTATASRDGLSYPWHDQNFQPPAFNDLIIYQFHVATFYGVDANGHDHRVPGGAKFLDVQDRIRYLADLGVNAIQPLPVVEFATEHSLGYNGTDYFSPEMDYAVPASDLDRYLATANQLLAEKARPPLTRQHLATHPNQLKALMDICHVWGMAVILDVVHNHASGDFGDESLYFFDRAINHSNRDSLYFTDQGWAGGLVFDFEESAVRQFLIDNARFYIDEYHADGFRYDEVTVIDRFGGWRFCQDLTDSSASSSRTFRTLPSIGAPTSPSLASRGSGGTSWSWRRSASQRGRAIGWDFQEPDASWRFSNSDVYDNFVNPRVAGNGGAINAEAPLLTTCRPQLR